MLIERCELWLAMRVDTQFFHLNWPIKYEYTLYKFAEQRDLQEYAPVYTI